LTEDVVVIIEPPPASIVHLAANLFRKLLLAGTTKSAGGMPISFTNAIDHNVD
jgi:hypothetical protein